jgi:Ca2+-binding EF-hand superfamily protein
LKHSAEITLQRFHAQQKSGKNSLDLEEFKLLMGNAFHFVSAIKKDNLHVIFGELDRDNDKKVLYKEFLGWILTDIAPRVR